MWAVISGTPVPFVGVHLTDACPQIYDKEGKNKVGCPLKAGQEYLYKNEIAVLPIYPTVSFKNLIEVIKYDS